MVCNVEWTIFSLCKVLDISVLGYCFDFLVVDDSLFP